MNRPLAVAAGLAADRLVGDPPDAWHPVAWFGRAMTAVESAIWADDRARGAVHAGIGVATGAAAGRLVRSTAAATTVAVGGRTLGATARRVGDVLLAGDLDAARRLLPALAGRSTDDLDETGVARAVIESVAENTVDAVVAPACWALAAGAPGVLAHRAVNTLDAMVGHRDARYARFGTASARLDDAMAWVPARLTAGLVAAARPRAAGNVWRAVRLDAPAHPSPNSGVAEAAFAAALGLRLGGPTRYGDRVEDRPVLGAGRPPAPADIPAAVRLADHVAALLAGLLAGVGVARATRTTRTRRRWR